MISKKYIAVVAQDGQNMWLKRKSNVKSFVSVLKKTLSESKKLKILDAGCANGRDSNEIALEGYKVIGIDCDKNFINDAKKSYPKTKFEIGDIQNLKYKNNEFDAVYCVNTLFYLSPNKSIPELLRVVKKDGVLFITLDEKIVNLDENKIMHSLNVEKTIKLLFKDCKILSKKYLKRIDKIPFKHKHYFYEIAVQK